jgi:hypothetical protein
MNGDSNMRGLIDCRAVLCAETRRNGGGGSGARGGWDDGSAYADGMESKEQPLLRGWSDGLLTREATEESERATLLQQFSLSCCCPVGFYPDVSICAR